MKLSAVERTLLLNQLAILKILNPKEARDYDEEIAILTEGFEIFYGDVVRARRTVSTEDCQFVLDVLSMFRDLDTYIRNHPKDEEVAKSPWARFSGFDGNNEGGLRDFALFLLKTQGKFTEQLPNERNTDGFNSHAHRRELYERMLAAYRVLNFEDPTHEQVMTILAAVRRP